MARLDKEQWAIIRERWESDPRTGYVWIVAELSLAVGDKAVLQRANREGWSKKIVTEVVTEVTKEPIREQNPVGRPTKFREEYINQAFQLSLLGCTDAEMADVFDIDVRTLDNWKVSYPEFFQSIKNGKTPADAVVATSSNHCYPNHQAKPKASTAKEKRVLATPKFTLLLFIIYKGTFLGMFQFKISGLLSMLGRKILRPEICLFTYAARKFPALIFARIAVINVPTE